MLIETDPVPIKSAGSISVRSTYKSSFTNDNERKAYLLEQERERYIVPGNRHEFTYKDISALRARLGKKVYISPEVLCKPELKPDDWELKRVETLSRIAERRASVEYDVFLESVKDIYGEHSLKYQRATHCLDTVEFTDNTSKVYYANYCNVRGCPVCYWHRRYRKAKRVYNILSKMVKKPVDIKHMILSLPNVRAEDMTAGFKDLKKYINKFRRLAAFKSNIFRHLMEFEFTIAKDKSINLHVHMYYAGRFWDVYKIKKLWDKITKGNNYVFIRLLIKKEDHPNYIKDGKPLRFKVNTDKDSEYFKNLWRRGWYLSKEPSIEDVEIMKQVIRTFSGKKTLMTGGFRKRGNNLIRKEK